MNQRYVVVDLETTGNDKDARMIQFSAVIIEKNQIIDQYTSFVNPGIPIPPFIEELTGITDETVADAPSFDEIAATIFDLFQDSIFVAHNVPFDRGFLTTELTNAGYPSLELQAIDTVELTKILLPSASSYKLNDLSDQFGIVHLNPHQADSDALATANIFLILLEIAKQLPEVTLKQLKKLSIHLQSDIFPLFKAIIAKKQHSIGKISDQLEIVRGIAIRKKQVNPKAARLTTEPFPRSKEEKVVLLQSYFNNQLEVREGQLEMIDAVYEAFEKRKHAVIEAGTGIGKSLAYLLPSVYFAVAHQERIVISTYTIQMQHQLLENEVAKLKKMVPFSFQAAILKGRDHYIDLLKFEQSLREVDAHYDEVVTKMKILVWLTKTKTGDVDELNLSSGGELFWQRLKHDGWYLEQKHDPWHSHDFYMHARNIALTADLIITNHALLLSDVEAETDILHKSNYVIIDEAHHLEKATRKRFGTYLQYHFIKFLLGKIGTIEKRKLLYRLDQSIKHIDCSPTLFPFEIEKVIGEFDDETNDLFNLLAQIFIQFQEKQTSHPRMQLRMTSKIRESRQWQAVIMCAERFLDNHRQITDALEERIFFLKNSTHPLEPSEQALVEEAQSFIEEWQDVRQYVRAFIIQPHIDLVNWIEGDMKNLPNSMSIHGQPFNAGEMIAELLLSKKESVILTSASLTVKQSFEFFNEETGAGAFKRIEKSIKSPFKYDQLAKIFIPTDIPEINTVSVDEYVEHIALQLISIATAIEGRMLVLFTSHDMLRRTYYLMKESGELENYIMLAHGISPGSRSRLLKTFQQFHKTILFGTNSFWEGIDIPGQDLSCLAIVRLPFSPPNEPITAAKLEAIKAEGKNPFLEYSLPKAILQFKQGFGRLIRSKTDKGVMVIFDRRIDTTSYGKEFLRSIPPVKVKREPLAKMVPLIKNWLFK